MKATGKHIRYAVVGAGHIAQNAVLPAFAHAERNSELTTIFSGDPRKLAALRSRYKVRHALGYGAFDEACRADIFDAVYIALPNSMHCEFACRAADAGVHVLCEKPMAVTSAECREMIRVARRAGVRLMIAYRLHFEEANLKAAEIADSGELGELRLFSAVFTMQVRDENIRLDADLGGGSLPDLGIYCINAARCLFRSQPLEVTAFASARMADRRFTEVEEAVSAVLRFPGERLANLTCSFGAADVSRYELVGTKGVLTVDPAFEYEGNLRHRLVVDGRTREESFRKRDQFAPELLYFSDCIRRGVEPEPGGDEGLADVRIIEAIYESARTGRAVDLRGLPHEPAPTMQQEIRRPAVSKKPPLVHAQSAHRE